MADFPYWCDQAVENVGPHALHVITARAEDAAQGSAAVAGIVPGHYAAEEQAARILRRLGRPATAAFIEGKLPTTKAIRSGDLGEILATEFIADLTPYSVPIKRLRWKDHRNMAMRGDDVIGLIRDNATGRLRFLKAEAKSRAALPAVVVALLKHGILPQSVKHLLFTFSGNDPANHLRTSLQTYTGGIAQQCVGVRVAAHGVFVAEVYDQVIANANDD